MDQSWLQVGALFLANAGLILWFRSESRADWRLMDSKMESFRAENGILIRAIQEEMKDFHSKLIKIEMERRQ